MMKLFTGGKWDENSYKKTKDSTKGMDAQKIQEAMAKLNEKMMGIDSSE